MKHPLLSVLALSASALLVLAGCAQPPAATDQAGEATETATVPAGEESPTPAESDFTACMVSDAGGFDDKSFNETAHNGMMQAQDELGIQTKQIESNAEGDYAGNLQAMIDANCNIIITVGFALATATEAAAKQNPEVKFAIVDYSSFEGVDNAKGLLFNTAEPAFKAGYLAAGMTETGTVGTFGGAKFPTVTIFMDGFAQGIDHHNEQKGTDVTLIGWDDAAQDGQFVGGNNPFGDIPGGKNTANTLIAQGADIILPVAGPAGLGALQAAKESGGKVNAIWVDTDGFISAPEFGPQLITSVEKGMDVAVFEAIKAAMDGTFTSDPYVGTLENGGVSLAPFNDFEDRVPDELKAELETIKADIISGAITLTSPSQP